MGRLFRLYGFTIACGVFLVLGTSPRALLAQWPQPENSQASSVRAGHSIFDPPDGFTDGDAPPRRRNRSMIQLMQHETGDDGYWLQFAPTSLLYKSYLAGEKESRIAANWLVDKDRGLIFETALGGRVGLVRYGNSDPLNPEGWQLDLEGAALPRVDPKLESDPLEAVDFRVGFLSTWRSGPTAVKAGYYHLSSHAGDEFLINNPTFHRINYVRDSAIIGISQDLTPDVTAYGEFAYAFGAEAGAEPIELQYGLQYTPKVTGWPGSPFVAVNGHTREDFGWITSINMQAGWLFRSRSTNRTFRLGMQYYDGPSMQWEFVNRHESLFGGGIWFDY